MAIIKVKSAGVDNTVNLGRRNLVINGAMQIAQRGTSTTTTSGNYAISPDRFRCYTGDYSTSPITASQSTDSPAGFSNSLKYNFDSADATPLREHSIYYSIEGQDLQHLQKGTANSKSLTLSFWCKASLSGTYIAELMDNDNGSKHINKSYTISSANTWEYKTITFEGDTVGTLDNDTGNSLSIIFWVAANSSNSSGTLQTSWGSLTQANRAVGQTNLGASANNAFYVTGVQLEVGDTATPFEHRSYGEELESCQRYYQIWGAKGTNYHAMAMWIYGTVQASASLDLPKEMRVAPTMSRVGNLGNSTGASVGTDTWAMYYSGSWVGCNALSTSEISPTSFRFDADSYDNMAAGGACGMYNGTNCYLTLEAEF